MISENSIREKLAGYPEPVLDACLRYRQDRRHEDLDTLIVGVLFFLLDLDPGANPDKLGDAARLREDLQVESITIAELLFVVEDLFDVEVANQDLAQVRTLGDLKGFLRSMSDSINSIE